MSIPRIAVILILYTPFPSKGGANRTKKQRLSFQSTAAQQKGSAEAHLRPTPILHKRPFKGRKADGAAGTDMVLALLTRRIFALISLLIEDLGCCIKTALAKAQTASQERFFNLRNVRLL